MKVLIWLACIFLYSVVTVLLRAQGVYLGGIPTILLAAVLVFIPAPMICKVLARRKEKSKQEPPVQAQVPIEERNKLCGTPFAQAGQTPPGTEPDVMERWYTCLKCGQLVREGDTCDCISVPPPEQENTAPVRPGGVSKKTLAVVVTVAAAICVLSTAAGIYLTLDSGYDRGWSDGYDVAEAAERDRYNGMLAKKEEEMQTEIDALEAKNEDFGEYLWNSVFLHEKIGFIVDGSEYYHDFDCSVFKGAESWWAHNIDYCEYLGYGPCPQCE